MTTKLESPNLFPLPRARRVADNAVSVTCLVPVSLVLTDAEAHALIQQLQVALAYPAPASEADANAEGLA